MSDYLGGIHSIGCASGTDALYIGLLALNVQPGDEIIIPDFTFISTGEVISLLSAVPVFCDVDPVTFNLNPELIENSITENTVGIIPVSIFGQCADLDAINAIAKKRGLWVMEDGAQSFGAEYNGKKSCTMTDIATTSFFPAKPLGAYGDGGAIFTDNDELASNIRMILNHGQSQRYHHKVIGLNGRMDSMQAAVLSVKLKHFDEELKSRRKAAEEYSRFLNGIVDIPQVVGKNTSVWAQYTIRHEKRDLIKEKLGEKGIPTAIHYPIPLHRQEAFAQLNNTGVNTPVTEKLSRTVMSLPIHPFLKSEDIGKVVKGIETVLGEIDAK
ncbi:MAG: DegT/DnrJ/EryC1/StrS family aminotransferase [Spirochaetia bacterium]|nr:DegT/DnrJ/EryC1/StrS family aminotransferase [Spirochaetia bacterium]